MLVSCVELPNRNPSFALKNVGSRTEISVLTFNILATVDLKARFDGYNSWNERKAAVFALIDREKADLVVIEEAGPSQLDEIRRHYFSSYVLLVNRGFTSDVVLLIKKSRFKVLDQGHWALEKPLHLNKIRRIALWASLRERESGRELMLVGAHLDGKDIKVAEAQRLKETLADYQGEQYPIFLAGDFNISFGEEGYSDLIDDGWTDSFTAAGFTGSIGNTYPYKKPTRRVDHVLYFGKGIGVQAWQLLDNGDDPPFSDHKAVHAHFSIDAAH
jgi:endonuclease/exonuclease/phosphatase family metal-dependent hydrolase